MRIELLGTGGALPTPRPGCGCGVCVEARERGAPYARTGPSLFLHGPDVLIDTPEESREQLVRAGIERVAACLYSHWHPDHVMGRRVFEALNGDFRRWPPRPRTTDVFLPEQVAADAKRFLGTWDHLAFLERQGVVRVQTVADGDGVTLGDVCIQPFRLSEDYVYAFVVEAGGARVLIAPDELYGWSPPGWVRGVDLAILPMGVVEFDPFTRKRRIAADHQILMREATFADTLGMVRVLGAKRVILTHIEEPDGMGYDDLARLGVRLREGGLPVEFAWDGMVVDVAG